MRIHLNHFAGDSGDEQLSQGLWTLYPKLTKELHHHVRSAEFGYVILRFMARHFKDVTPLKLPWCANTVSVDTLLRLHSLDPESVVNAQRGPKGAITRYITKLPPHQLRH